MEVFAKLTRSRAGRVMWALVAVLLAAALAASTVMAGKALTHEKSLAEQRATVLTNTVLVNALTPQELSGVILGTDYRSLIATIQAQILGDGTIGPGAVALVRIWKPDGTLIFSTAQRDKAGQFVATGNRQIQEALAGRTVSLLTGEQVAPKAGLQGSEERLYETFVPLHLPSRNGVLAAVQIDTRYSAITAAANRVWRPVQLGSLALLVLALLLFVLSLRTRTPIAPLATGLETPVDERVRGAELVAKEYQGKLAESTQRIAALEAELGALREKAAQPAGKSRAEAEVERLAAALKESESERDRGTREVRRVLESVTALEAEVAEANARLAQSESARVGLEARVEAVAAGSEKSKATKDGETAGGPSDVELELREVTAKLAEAQERAKTSEEGRGRAIGELEQLRASLAGREEALADREEKLMRTRAALQQLESEVEDLRAGVEAKQGRIAELESSAATAAGPEAQGAKVSELESRVRELEEARRGEIVELQTAQERLANSQAELIAATKRAKEAEEELKRVALSAGASAPARVPAAPPPESYEEPGEESGEEPGAASAEESGEEPGAASAEEPSSEAESLRSRLARAAAARHRTSSRPPGDSSRPEG